jgi:cyclopropane fatty-acyl-phospholipid synthase-like methyltransferase
MFRLAWDERCAAVRDAIASGKPSGYRGRNLWDVHSRSSRQAELFTTAMHAHSVAPARAFAGAANRLAAGHLLDVGGGSGAFAIALARGNPRLTVTVMDLAAVCVTATQMIADHGIADRVTVLSADMFTSTWPAADYVLFSEIFHNWPPKDCRTLARLAHTAMRPGGMIFVHEMLLQTDRCGPVAVAAEGVSMATLTGGQQFTAEELTEILSAAGFSDIEVFPSFGYYSIIKAVRK